MYLFITALLLLSSKLFTHSVLVWETEEGITSAQMDLVTFTQKEKQRLLNPEAAVVQHFSMEEKIVGFTLTLPSFVSLCHLARH